MKTIQQLLPEPWRESGSRALVAFFRVVRAPVEKVGPDPLIADVGPVRVVRNAAGLRKRDFEDQVVGHLCGPQAPAEFRIAVGEFIERLNAATWRVLSATKADRLLRERLFARVFAVRVNRFAQNYRNAEVDMHFSLTNDLTSLSEFLQLYKDGGLQGLTSSLARGLI